MPVAPLPDPAGGHSDAARPGYWPQSRPDSLETRAEIDAEIADHLASAAGEAARQGMPPDAATENALRRFGDVAAIRRKCWWIQQGDQIMLRVVAGGLFLTLLIAIVALGLGGWRAQTALADRLDRLTNELTTLGETQKALLDQQARKQPPEIRGRAYLGGPSQPAADVEIQIWNASEMKIFRRVRTDADGRFRSNTLPPGDYFVLAPLVGERNFLLTKPNGPEMTYAYLTQSEPLYLYAGSETAEVSLDVKFYQGQISIEFRRPELEWKFDPDKRPEFRLTTRVLPRSQHTVPYNPNAFSRKKMDGVGNVHWPLSGASFSTPLVETFDRPGTEPVLIMNHQLVPLPGHYVVAVIADPYLDLGDGEEFPRRINQVIFPSMATFPTIEVTDGKRTHLKITVSDEALQQLRDLPSHGEESPETQSAFLPRPAKIEVINDLPLLATKE